MTGRGVASRAFRFPNEPAEMTAGTWVYRIWDRETKRIAEQKKRRADQRAEEWKRLREFMLDPTMGVVDVMFKDASGNIVGGVL